MDFTGKTALVVGAGSGIAKETALQFAKYGAKVVVAGLNEDNAKQTAKEIQELGGEAIGLKLDVTNHNQILDVINESVTIFGHLDIAVNAATARPDFTSLINFDEKKYDLNMDVDLKGVIFSMKYEIEQMLKQGNGGVVVNISSAGVELGGSVMLGYNCAKVGVRKVSQMAAVEFGQNGIRINTVSPGSTETPLAVDIIADMKDSGMAFSLEDGNTKSNVLGRNAKPIDQANAIVFLCSDEASYITGQNINVDGGLTVL